MPTFCVFTLGCKVNAYESQGYIKGLKELGYQEVSDDQPSDICIINTCSVTNTAASKSRQKISHAKRLNPNALICAVGCYIQTEDKLDRLDVDVVIGSQNKDELPKLIDEAYREKRTINEVKSMNDAKFEAIEIDEFEHKTRAFIKIQDGCNQFCSYCIIPYARGRQRSMPLEQVIEQAKKLSKNHKEIVLTGIQTGQYGNDLGISLLTLLKELVKIEGLERIRLSSIEINELDDEMIEFMRNNPKMGNHLHIPIQSGCDRTLKMMNRPYDMEFFKKRIAYIRQMLPNVSISTDIILGFPDEREEDFEETLHNLEEIDFSFMHIFPYSKRDGTNACRIPNHLPNDLKKQRCKKVDEINQKGNEKYRSSFVGKDTAVLFEYVKGDYVYGHNNEYVMVKCPKDESLINEIVDVKVVDYDDEALIGEKR